MITNDQELYEEIVNIVNNYDEVLTDEDLTVLDGIYKIFNDAEFERLHPRDKDGKFARTSGGDNAEYTPSPEYTATLERVKESNNKNITPEDILKSAVKNLGLDEKEVREKINFAEDYVSNVIEKGLETNKRFLDKDGVYTPERQKEHDRILSEIFANEENAKPKDGERPTVIFLGGRGGSGKSKFNGLVYDESKYIVLDADKIKEMLPEYEGYNAYEVHEESSEILNIALARARKQGLNVVYDATMKTLSSTEGKIKAFADSDYNIEMYYMHLPREKAAERAIGRFMGERGRYVPLKVLLGMKDNEANFDQLKHYASKWAFYNNDVPNKNDKPILIDKNY